MCLCYKCMVWCVCVFGGGGAKGKQKCSSYSVTSARMCMNNQLTGRYMKRDYIKEEPQEVHVMGNRCVFWNNNVPVQQSSKYMHQQN